MFRGFSIYRPTLNLLKKILEYPRKVLEFYLPFLYARKQFVFLRNHDCEHEINTLGRC